MRMTLNRLPLGAAFGGLLGVELHKKWGVQHEVSVSFVYVNEKGEVWTAKILK